MRLRAPRSRPHRATLILEKLAAASAFALLLWTANAAHAGSGATVTGQSGLINMPDGRIQPDGTLRMGVSYADPYQAYWSSLSVVEFLEIWGRYTRIIGAPGFTNEDIENEDFGDFKDKSAGFKLRLLQETSVLPALAFGAEDFFGTKLFESYHLTASKTFGDFDFTAGFGAKRIDGLFGGVRYSPAWLPNWALLIERDKTDFSRDIRREFTGVARRGTSTNYGVEYNRGPFTLQVGQQHDQLLADGYVSFDLNQKTFNPKVNEPPPYVKVAPRPPSAPGQLSVEQKQAILVELVRDNFQNIRLDYQGQSLRASLTNSRISRPSRAAGRAVRIMLALGPADMKSIIVNYTEMGLPLVTYTFFDLPALSRFLHGMAPRKGMINHFSIRYANPNERRQIAAADIDALFDGLAERPATADSSPTRSNSVFEVLGSNLVSFNVTDTNMNSLGLNTYLSTFFNDPSGAFHYDFGIQGKLRRRLTDSNLFLDGVATAQLLEDVSDVKQESNSKLPHVRSDIAEYNRGSPVKLTKLLLNQFWQPAERWYARASAGYYEEMYAGAGAQLLFITRGNDTTVDVAVDELRQRDFDGGLDFRDYRTLTALVSVGQKLPMNLTATVRAGRFLAKDTGARFEIMRTFDSGIQFGAWYTRTDAKDTTPPGSRAEPYYDKGVFLTVPLEILLTKDSRAAPTLTVRPWTRDGGQMVDSPADLTKIIDRPLRNVHKGDGLDYFGGIDHE